MKYLKKLLLVAILGSFMLLGTSCAEKASESVESSSEKAPGEGESGFDPTLAEKYGADDYGMKKYVMAFLKRGPNQGLDSLQKIELQAAHMENITRMAEAGKLVLAGPFFGNDDLRGIYIFDVQSLQEAEELTRTDPAIQEGLLVMDLKEWYGSAALVGVNDTHKSLMKKTITEN